MQKLLEFIIKNIVDHPKEVKIKQQKTENNFLILNLSVHPSDMGKVIGKQGKIIKAIRHVLGIKAVKEGIRFSLNLQESSQSE